MPALEKRNEQDAIAPRASSRQGQPDSRVSPQAHFVLRPIAGQRRAKIDLHGSSGAAAPRTAFSSTPPSEVLPVSHSSLSPVRLKFRVSRT